MSSRTNGRRRSRLSNMADTMRWLNGLIDREPVVNMPPRSKTTMEIEVKAVRRALPHIVEPWDYERPGNE